MEPDPLLEWNRLNKENAEQSLISAMYSNLVARAPQVDTFSTWLLAGAGAAATLMVSNIQNLLSALGARGFKVALSFLVISGLFGLFSKCVFVFFQYGSDLQKQLFDQIKPILEKHKEDEKKIIELAKQRGHSLETGLSLDKIFIEFMSPFPSWSHLFIRRFLNKNKNNRQAAYVIPIKAFIWHCNFTGYQLIAFIGFILATIRYARAI